MASLYMQLIAGALLMRTGLAMHSAGSVRSKNTASVVGRQLLDWAIAVLAFWAIGAAIALQSNNGFFSLDPSMLLGRGRESAVLIGGLCRAMVVGAFVIGATSERSRIGPMLLLSLVTAGLTWPVVRAWIGPDGILGRHHFAGGAAIYLVGGAVAAAAAPVVGPRDGKYHRDGSSSVIPGHSFAYIVLGALLFSVGAALCASHFVNIDADTQLINICLSSAAAVLAASLFGQMAYGKIDLHLLACGLIAGVVSTSASGSHLAGWGAVLVGLFVGFVIPIVLVKVDMALKVDDVTGMISIAGVTGFISTLTAITYEETTWAERGKSLIVQAGGAAIIVLLSGVITYLLLKLVSRFTSLKAKEADEFDGLDLAEHDIGAYPDFQQTTIKSYHLREA